MLDGFGELACLIIHVDGTYYQVPPQQTGGAAVNPPPLSQGLREIATLLQARLASQDRLLAEQARKIAELEQARQQMGEHLLRAEGQLELLKELFLADGPPEPL